MEIFAVPIPLCDRLQDRTTWAGESSGNFSSRSAYKLLKQAKVGIMDHSNFQWIWKLPCTERVRFFVWLLSKDRLTPMCNWVHHNVTDSAACPRCMDEVESAIHLFRECPFAKETWAYWMMSGLNDPTFFSSSLQDWFFANCHNHKVLVDGVAWFTQFVFTLWYLWKSRNDLIFNRQSSVSRRVWFNSRKVANEVKMAMEKNIIRLNKVPKFVKGRPPDTGRFILNTDGAFKVSTGVASAGGLIWDWNGQWVKGFTDSQSVEL